MKKTLKILALFDAVRPTTLDQDLSAELRTADWKTEAAVLAALRELGHAHETLALFDDMDLLRQKLQTFRPDVIFNLADQFRNDRALDQHIAAYLAMHGLPFTGCGPLALALCKNKAIAKRLVASHGIRTARFVTIPRDQRRLEPPRLAFPLIVKPLREEASYGISGASFVRTPVQYGARVRYLQERTGDDILVEEYVDGREIYVSLIGRRHPQVCPIRELVFGNLPPGAPRIATYQAKWDLAYRRRRGVESRFVTDLAPAVIRRIAAASRTIYRALEIDGYARLDLRLTADNEIVFIEANPNPMLAPEEDFAQSAMRTGLTYPQLIDRIARLGMRTPRA